MLFVINVNKHNINGSFHLLSTLAWIVTATDITAAIFHKHELGFSDPYHNNKNLHIFGFIPLLLMESIVIVFFDIIPWCDTIRGVLRKNQCRCRRPLIPVPQPLLA